ncbi:MAG TPA: hypothetical protein VF762_19705 [Blastocatellia bacterium]|jgi:uncharacterized membrane protein
MSFVILGWILIVVGVIAIIAGVAGGIAEMFKQIKHKAANAKAFGPAMLPTDFLKALTAFLNALVKAPLWLALVFVGIALVAWGVVMLPNS